MADKVDEAGLADEFMLRVSLQAAKRNYIELEAALNNHAGHCLFCGASITLGRYCDSDCGDDHQADLRAKRFRV